MIYFRSAAGGELSTPASPILQTDTDRFAWKSVKALSASERLESCYLMNDL